MSYHDAEFGPYIGPDLDEDSRISRRAVVLAAVVCLAIGAGGVAVGVIAAGRSALTHTVTVTPMGFGHAPGGGVPDAGGGMPQMNMGTPPAGGGMSSSGTANSDLAKRLGASLAGNGQQAIPLARAQALGNQVPAGAQVDAATNTIRFTTSNVSFVVLASPPSSDMKFRTAGLDNPTIEVPPNAQVSVQFINGDNNEAHMWLLQAGESGPTSGGPWNGGDHVAAAPPLGNPTSAGQPSETINFAAPSPGAYHYSCPFPGHATQGMYGRFVVENS